MYSDDEEAEIAVEIRCLWCSRIPALSMGQKEPIKPALASVRNKDPSIVATHYDPHRRRLYYGLDDGAVCFWHMTESSPTSNASRFVGAHKGPVSAICAPRPTDGDLGKGNLLVTGSVDSSIKIWDYQGKVMLDPTVCVQTLYGHSGTVTALVILGDYIISSSTDGAIKMWRQEEGRRQLVYPWFEMQVTVSGMEGWVRCMSFDSSGDVGDMGAMYAADESGGITKIVPEALWDDSIQRLSTRMEFRVDRRVEHLHDRSISIIRYVSKWDLVLTVAYDQCIRAYDVKTDTVRHCWSNERQCQFTTLEVNLEFGEILAGDTSGVISIFSIRSGRLMVTKHLAQPAATGSGSRRGGPGGSNGVGGGSLHTVVAVLGRQLYAVVTSREIGLWFIEHELDYNIARGGHEKAVISLYTCSGGAVAGPGADLDYRIFSASLDNTVRLWDPYDMACIRVMEEMSSEVSTMTFFEGWNLLLTGHDNGDIRLWNLDTGHATTLRRVHSNAVTALALALVHRNEELLISASYDGWVVLWDIRSLRGEPPHMVAKFRAHGPDAPCGSRLHNSNATADEDGDSSATSSQQQQQQQQGGSGLVGDVSMGAGGPGTARTSSSSALRMLLASKEPEILALKYDPLKKAIVTAGTEKIIKVWAATGYDFLGCHRGHRNAVTCLALDSNFLFSGSDDCTICLWDTVPAVAKSPHLAGSRLGAGHGVAAGGAGPQSTSSTIALKAPFSTRPLKVLTGHQRSVTGLDVLPSSGNLVSCSLDGQLLVWDYVAGQVLHRFTHATEEFRCLALRYDRPEVLVGTLQANLLRYPLHEPAVAVPGVGRASSHRGHGRHSGTGSVLGGLHGAMEGLALNGASDSGAR